MAGTLTKMIDDLLANPTNIDVVSALVDPEATYVSLNYDNPELKKVMPWAGTSHGPRAVAETYAQVGRYWKNKGMTITDRIESSDTAAVFGSFTYQSNTVGKEITSPFCIMIRVKNGKIVYMQFMEDTFGTASTFRQGGAWEFHSDPDGSAITV